MNEPLFREFEKISAKQWKQKIQVELKGEDYNEALVTKTRDSIDIKPFYHQDDTGETYTAPSPAQWSICEKIYVANEEKSNKRAQNAIAKGAEDIWFIIPSEETDLTSLFKGLDTGKTNFYISPEFLSEGFFKKLQDQFPAEGHRIRIQQDIIGNLARTGNWYSNQKEDHQTLQKVFQQDPHFDSLLSIDGTLYQNSGATIPQELAYCMAHANEYLNSFGTSKAFSEGKEIQFIVSAGSNYFFEIAKIRALRLLYASLAGEYNLPETCHILAQPTKRDKTLYDYNVNLLRTTTQSMSMVLGGANSVYNLPYDAIYHKNNEFGDRIARNQLLVLKHESYLDKVSNAAQGSYYIETLTRQLAEKALEIFKEIEAGGGFLAQLKEGVIQRKIAESAQKEQKDFDKGELVLIGTNKFQNPDDRMKGELELFPFLKKNPRKTLIPPILERRLAENHEQDRLEKE